MRFTRPVCLGLIIVGGLWVSFRHVHGQQPAVDTKAYRWAETADSIALLKGEETIWRFNFADEENVPYFHPLTASGKTLTWDSPGDHPWHRAMWFCWKYINGVNFWEYDAALSRPPGQTRWSDVVIEKREDFSTRIEMTLSYRTDDESVLMTEQRILTVSPPDKRGATSIAWSSRFEALQPVELDRTPPLAEGYGGYAGLSIRFAENLREVKAVGTQGAVEFNAGGRFRGASAAIDYNGVIEDQEVGIAVLDDPENPRHPTKWYLIDTTVSRYLNAAILNDEPMMLDAGESLALRYRVIVHPERWSFQELQDELPVSQGKLRKNASSACLKAVEESRRGTR